jgi:hypothetical protein
MTSIVVSEHSRQADGGARVRQAFVDQAGYCDQLGSPFTALLCRVLADGLEGTTDIERHILEWPGDASAFGDSVPLRVAGALHYLVRAGRSPAVAALYPPHTAPDPATLLATARAALLDNPSFVRDFLQSPPQTNEVGRSAALIAGWLEIAARTRFPLELFEIGSSAGLNLIADRYAYRFGEFAWSAAGESRGQSSGQLSAPTLGCEWTGRSPAVDAPLRVQSRRGCDRHPLNVVDPAQRERLLAYVWADQGERIERLNAAIRTMLAEPAFVETADAADWIQSVIGTGGAPGVTRVVFHSIVWSYLGGRAQQRIANHLAEVGAASSPDRPLAWLRLELVSKDEPAALRLTLWPDGEDQLLARVHPHGAWVHWAS